MNKKKKFTFIDLFAGIGGMRLAFQRAGGKCVFSSEIDKYAKKTYKENFNDIPYGDIKDIHESNIPDHDILLGGFPCQPFSLAGTSARRHHGGKEGFADTTRGTLFFDIVRIIKEKKPKAFLLENVKGLKGHDKGKTLATILEILHKLGYQTLEYSVLNAKDFGLPQNRERIFIVGFRDYVLFQFPNPPMIKTKVGDILDSKVPEKYTISNKMWEGAQRRKLNHRKKGYGFGFSIFSKDSVYTSTISARYYKDGAEIWIEQGSKKNPRKITPNEARKLQGFPAGFKIPISDVQAYKQFGNAVPVSVVRAIMQRMVEFI